MTKPLPGPGPDQIAYTLAQAAAKLGMSLPVIKRAIADGDLTRRYPNSKPYLGHDDLVAYFYSLPLEPPRS